MLCIMRLAALVVFFHDLTLCRESITIKGSAYNVMTLPSKREVVKKRNHALSEVNRHDLS